MVCFTGIRSCYDFVVGVPRTVILGSSPLDNLLEKGVTLDYREEISR
jgi:hypothetical protein